MKLTNLMPDGKKTTAHPLTWCMKNRLGERTKSDLAREMGVKPQSLYKWEAKARLDRHFSLPLERAVQAAGFFAVHPKLFRPDVAWDAVQKVASSMADFDKKAA